MNQCCSRLCFYCTVALSVDAVWLQMLTIFTVFTLQATLALGNQAWHCKSKPDAQAAGRSTALALLGRDWGYAHLKNVARQIVSEIAARASEIKVRTPNQLAQAVRWPLRATFAANLYAS